MNNKQYYTKSEITKELGIQPYIMALWEKQFSIEAFVENGQSLYSATDLQKLRSIKNLIYDKGLTLEAAKKQFMGSGTEAQTYQAAPLLFETTKKTPMPLTQELLAIQHQLIKLRNLL